MHGYRIKKTLDDESLRFWFPLEFGSIYAALRGLVRGGHVEVVAVEREGQRPARTRYRITPEGRDHLEELLERAWRELPSPADPVQLALAARSELPDARTAELLEDRIEALHKRLGTLERVGRSAPAAEMVERQLVLTKAELEWAEALKAKEREL